MSDSPFVSVCVHFECIIAALNAVQEKTFHRYWTICFPPRHRHLMLGLCRSAEIHVICMCDEWTRVVVDCTTDDKSIVDDNNFLVHGKPMVSSWEVRNVVVTKYWTQEAKMCCTTRQTLTNINGKLLWHVVVIFESRLRYRSILVAHCLIPPLDKYNECRQSTVPVVCNCCRRFKCVESRRAIPHYITSFARDGS